MAFGSGGWGSTPWGSGEVGGDSFEFRPALVGTDGGYLIQMRGDLPEGTYRMHFGTAGDTTDPLMYSGIIGQGADIVISNGEFEAWTPPTAVGGAGIHMVKVSGPGAATFDTGQIFSVSLPPVRGEVVQLRALLPRKWRVSTRQVA